MTRRPAYSTPPRQRSVFEPNELEQLRRKDSDSYSNSLYANRKELLQEATDFRLDKSNSAKRLKKKQWRMEEDSHKAPSSPTRRLGKFFLGKGSSGVVTDKLTSYVLKKSLEPLSDW